MIHTTPQTHGRQHASHSSSSGQSHADHWLDGRYFVRYTAHDAHHVHVIITNTQPEHAAALGAMQKIIFPTLPDEEHFSEAKYRKHIELFPEGQFVALVEQDGGWLPVGATSTYRTQFDFAHYQHTYIEAIADGWLTCHNPIGEWLYGVDMAIHPQYRGLRIGRRLYDARQALVRRLNLRGEIAGALMPHYDLHRKHLSIAQYALRVWQGKLYDPTLTMQIRNGFKIRALLYDHIGDPRSDNTAALIVRENPHYQAEAGAAD